MPITIFNPASYQQFQGSGLQVYNPPPPIGIVTSGSLLYLDAAISSSYPGTGTNWFSLTSNITASLTAITASSTYLEFTRANNSRAITTSSVNLSTTNAATIDMWIRFKTRPTNTSSLSGDYQRITYELSEDPNLYSDSFGGDMGYQPLATSVNLLAFEAFIKGNIGYNFKGTTGSLVNTDVWYHWVTIYDTSQTADNEIKHYLNGVQLTDITSDTGGVLNSNNTNNFGNRQFYIGGRGTTQFSMDMFLGAFIVYNRALTQAEITQNFNVLRGRYGI
jgi:hypothetical protein